MRSPNAPPPLPKDAALWWATKRLADPEKFSASRAFPKWLENPENFDAWERLKEQDVILEALAGDADIYAMRGGALALMRGSEKPRRARFGMLALAASVAAVIATPLLIADDAVTPVPTNVAEEPALRLATAKGERHTFRLKDGSRVSLNAETIVEARYSNALRDIRLVSGQALFHVAPDKSRPFTVSAAGQIVTATGTAFDVAVRRDGSVRVSLLEGHVRIEPSRRSGLARLIPALARENLDPGQQLTASINAPPEIGVGDVEEVTAWNRGLVILRDEKLSEALDAFNRHTDRQIIALDPDIQELKVSGMFAVDGSQDFLIALQTLYPISVDGSGRNIVISWRPQAQQTSSTKN